jgi:hypothetical protein
MNTENASARKLRKVKPSEKKNIEVSPFCRAGVLRASRIACVGEPVPPSRCSNVGQEAYREGSSKGMGSQ